MAATTALDEITEVAAQLRDVLIEIEDYSNRVGNTFSVDRETGEKRLVLGSEARWRMAYNVAYEQAKQANLRSENDRKQYAESESFDEWAVYNADQTALRIAKERAHSLRQILSSYQTAARVEADLAR